MHLPETTQTLKRSRRQGDQAILTPLGIADMHPLAHPIDITHLQAQAFAQTQAETVAVVVKEDVALFKPLCLYV